jgi:D-glycero-beta-D-manno-heptose-7-phosphate kinase
MMRFREGEAGLTRERARKLVRSFTDQRVLVVGDLMLDRYIYGAVRRISPEAPVPVVNVTHEKSVPGGASNVAWNVSTLGGRGEVAGIVGLDNDGRTLTSLLKQSGVGVDAVSAYADMRTTVKTRVLADRQQIVRVDWEDGYALQGADLEAFTVTMRAQIEAANAVVIEDYGKGLVSQPVVDAAIEAAQTKGIPIGYDPKSGHALRVAGVTVATPNRKEAYAAVGREEPLRDHSPLDDPELVEVTQALRKLWGVELLVVTLGSQGMFLLDEAGQPVHVPTRAREVFDVSGAGDTVIAVCTAALAAGATHREAVELANYAAGVVVAKLGTAPCYAEELLERVG